MKLFKKTLEKEQNIIERVFNIFKNWCVANLNQNIRDIYQEMGPLINSKN